MNIVRRINMMPSMNPVNNVVSGFRPSVDRCIRTIIGRKRMAVVNLGSLLTPLSTHLPGAFAAETKAIQMR